MDDNYTSMTLPNITPRATQGLNTGSNDGRVMIYMSIPYVLGTVFGSLGNILVFLVVCLDADMKKPIYILIGNLAIADWLVTFVCLPVFTVYYVFYWPIYPYPAWVCKLMAHLIHGASLSSVFTLLAITYNRFFAICYPFKRRLQLNRRKTIYLVGLIWLVSLGSTLPSPLVHAIADITLNGEQLKSCFEVWSTKASENAYLLYRIIAYIIFVFQILVLYYRIGRTMVKRKIPGQTSQSVKNNHNRLKSKRKVIKMMAIICTFFTICWLPYMTIKFLVVINPRGYKAPDLLVVAGNFLAMMNSVINPYLYLITQKFRTGLKKLLTCRARDNLQNSVSSVRLRKSSSCGKQHVVQLKGCAAASSNKV